MTPGLSGALDDARAVWVGHEWVGGCTLVVWHGGHTVNVYDLSWSGEGLQLTATEAFTTGDFETGETSRSQAEAVAHDVLADSEAEARVVRD